MDTSESSKLYFDKQSALPVAPIASNLEPRTTLGSSIIQRMVVKQSWTALQVFILREIAVTYKTKHVF